MSESFLDVVNRLQGDHQDGGDEHGGAAGADGRGLPDGSPRNFLFATGIECSYPTIENGRIRRDQLEETRHYECWRQDLSLVRDLGLRVLRYGLPYHKTHLGPGRYDWEFSDLVMAEMRRLEITPILDLLHFGVPDWLGDFQNPDLAIHFSDYAAAVAERYPWVRYYTPVNEVYVTARASAKDGLWNEQLKTDQAFVTAMKNIVAASILATQAIAKRTPNAIVVQSESAECIHEARSVQSAQNTLANKLKFLSLDLLYGNPPDADICMYLLDNGMSRAEYDWFMRGEPPGYQVMGNDYYGRNEKIILPNGEMIIAEDIYGWYQLTKEYYLRYHKPVMHTETNVLDAEAAPTWLWKQWVNVLRMRNDGVPVLGFTWYSLIDQIDWDIELAEKRGTVNACGLYDLNRKPRPVAAAYNMLLEEFGHMTIIPHAEMLAITDSDASLKVKV